MHQNPQTSPKVTRQTEPVHHSFNPNFDLTVSSMFA
jgi:hypothetical protein